MLPTPLTKSYYRSLFKADVYPSKNVHFTIYLIPLDGDMSRLIKDLDDKKDRIHIGLCIEVADKFDPTIMEDR